MAVIYAVKKCSNPRNPDVDYYAARVQKTGVYDFDQLSEDINNSTTVTAADVAAVLKAMKSFITKALLAGQIVALDDLCRMQVGITGKCYPKEVLTHKEFSPSAMIRGVHINFRPDKDLLKKIKNSTTFKRISSDAMA